MDDGEGVPHLQNKSGLAAVHPALKAALVELLPQCPDRPSAGTSFVPLEGIQSHPAGNGYIS